MNRLWPNLALLTGVAIIVAPVAISQPVNPYVLTATKIATALGYTPANGANYLPLTGGTLTGPLIVSGTSLSLSGNISSAAWTTNGVRYKNVAATLTDTSSSGTVATAYTDVWGGNTVAASSATTYTNYFGAYFKAPIAGTNATFTNKYALGADSIDITGTAIFAGGLSVTGGGALTVGTGGVSIGQSSTVGVLIGFQTASTLSLSGSAGVIGFVPSASNVGASLDTGISRGSAAQLLVGNGTFGDFSGTVKATGYQSGANTGISKTCIGATGTLTFTNGLLTSTSGC